MQAVPAGCKAGGAAGKIAAEEEKKYSLLSLEPSTRPPWDVGSGSADRLKEEGLTDHASRPVLTSMAYRELSRLLA